MVWRALVVPAALAMVLCGGCGPRRRTMGTSPSFPDEANGWRSAGRTKTFGRDTVFEYMDGAGELYLAYDFRRVHVHEYARPDSARIVAEAYEMTTSEDAWGVFSHDPEGDDVGIGQGNAYAAGLLRFWKGTWFFRILAERETPEAKAAVLAIARSLASPLAEGPVPAILRQLPPDDLDAASVRYFHTQVSLNSVYYLADDNILRLSPRTEAVLAAYRPKSGKLLLLLVRYESREQAEGAYREFNRVYLKDRPPPTDLRRVESIEQGRQVGVLAKGQFLVLVFDARTRRACDRLLDAAAARL